MFWNRDSDDDDSSRMEELLKQTEHDDKNQRKEAIKELAALDLQYAVVMERLEFLSENDGDRGTRKEANKALKQLRNKPMAESQATTDAGEEGTGFDDEIGDSSLESGEYDFESSLSDEEEDRREREAEGKGLLLEIKEKNTVEMDYSGQVVTTGGSTGQILVQNTGSRDRITGIDLILSDVDQVQSEEELEENINIGVLGPGREHDWTFDYTFEKDLTPITVEQEYIDPQTDLSPNFSGGTEREFEVRIKIKNTTTNTITNIVGKKELNEIATLIDTDVTDGEVSTEGNVVRFEIDELDAHDEVDIVLTLQAALPEEVHSYTSGRLNVTYDKMEELDSGLRFVSIDGISDSRQRVRRRQREKEPGVYDCEFKFENESEFVFDLNRFTVFAGDFDSQEVVLDWDGTEASEDDREIVPGEDVVFEFIYESPDEPPTFGEYISYSVQYDAKVYSRTKIILPAQELRYMAIELSKVFLDGEEQVMEFELPSYKETEVPTLVTLTDVGTYPIEALKIRDEILEGFRGPEDTSQIEVKRSGVPLSETNYTVIITPEDLQIEIEHLEETESGALEEGETIELKYNIIADRPEPREEPLRSQAHAEGWVYDSPDSKVKALSNIEEMRLLVIHKRADIDISKFTKAIDHNGRNGYRVSLEAENYGSSTVKINIRDLVPRGFDYDADTIETSTEATYSEPSDMADGKVHGWTFDNVEPENAVSISYVVYESEDRADPRELQKIYQG